MPCYLMLSPQRHVSCAPPAQTWRDEPMEE
jgi:hypothetical protein